MNHSDEYWMGLALAEAMKGRGRTSPNPMVGAVVVRDDQLLAKGFHHRAGLPHAEIEAFKKTKNLKNATLYVTLEPCCHEGKRTPPCTQSILKSGIHRVVIGTVDPNPLVSGKGIRQLKRAGIKTTVGTLREDCQNLNLFYNHWVVKKAPWVVLKIASSMDGKVALPNGRSRWITSETSRKWVHQLRSEVDAILVGVGTVLADDPELTARLSKKSPQPLRVVLDPKLRIHPAAKILTNLFHAQTLLIVSQKAMNSRKALQLKNRGIEILSVPTDSNGRFQLKKLLHVLGKKGILSLMVEGGTATWTEFLNQKIAREMLFFIAPKILGGDAHSIFNPLKLKKIPKNSPWQLNVLEKVGEDLLLSYRLT